MKIAQLSYALACILVFSSFICSCSNKPENDHCSTSQSTSQDSEISNISPSESDSSTLGEYSADSCSILQGFFLSYNDGSFDYYESPGYCFGFSADSLGFYGVFAENSRIPDNTVINNNSNLVLFSKASTYSVTLHPIHASVSAFLTTSDENVLGYGMLTGHSDLYSQISIHYLDNTIERFNPIYMNGQPAIEYQAVKIEKEVTPYKGMPSKVEKFTNIGFQENSTLTLGLSEGTSLIEVAYDVDSTYFDCHPDHNNWEEEDIYYAKLIPTSAGYATIDLSHIPSGNYIMLYRSNNKYQASIIEWQNT